MAVISRTTHTDRAINTATIFTRAAVAVGIPLYLYFNLDSIPTLNSPPGKWIAASVVVLGSPSTLYCALGALEGVVRSCIQYFNYQTSSNPEFHWDQFSKEVKTTSGLVQATISPLAGYTFMAREWNKLGAGRDKDSPRVLKEEYITYSGLRSAAYHLVDAGKWCVRQFKNGIETTVSAVRWVWRASQPYRELAWNIGVAIKNWSIGRLVKLWNFSKPVWKFLWDNIAVQLIWTSLIKSFLGHFVLKTVIWEIFLKTLIWDFVIKTAVFDWIVTKIFINLICKFIIGKIIWPPVRFVFKELLWPIIKVTFNFLGTIIRIAFETISWAVQQAFRRGR
jgi:hypothetical protein